MPSQQNFSNHTRMDPPIHFFVLPVLVITVVAAAVHAMHTKTAWDHWLIVVAIAGLVLLVRMRAYALKVQDRVIRLEERIRLTSLATERLRPRIGELTESQLIALRFASDAEAPALAEKALLENLTAKQIKQAIQSWRADHWRV